MDIMLRTEEPIKLQNFWYYMIALVAMFAISTRYQLLMAEAEESKTDDNFEEV